MSPSVTVVLMAYNQKEYIRQALDNILSQQTTFDFDIFIHDDCSGDGTYEILKEYQKQYPQKIKILHQETRKFISLGFNKMILNYVVPNIHSDFIAYCDGDDYWCDNKKIQKQYEFLLQNPDYSMCFHSAYQLKNNHDMSSKWFILKERDYSIDDFVNDQPGIKVATSSIFIKTSVFKDFSEWRLAYPVEDVPLYMTAALHGKIRCQSDVMSVYRQFSNGSWTSQNRNSNEKKINHLVQLIEATRKFNEQTNKQYNNLVQLQISSCEFRLALIQKQFDKIFNSSNKRYFKKLPLRDRISLKLQYRMPRLYNLFHKKEN